MHIKPPSKEQLQELGEAISFAPFGALELAGSLAKTANDMLKTMSNEISDRVSKVIHSTEETFGKTQQNIFEFIHKYPSNTIDSIRKSPLKESMESTPSSLAIAGGIGVYLASLEIIQPGVIEEIFDETVFEKFLEELSLLSDIIPVSILIISFVEMLKGFAIKDDPKKSTEKILQAQLGIDLSSLALYLNTGNLIPLISHLLTTVVRSLENAKAKSDQGSYLHKYYTEYVVWRIYFSWLFFGSTDGQYGKRSYGGGLCSLFFKSRY